MEVPMYTLATLMILKKKLHSKMGKIYILPKCTKTDDWLDEYTPNLNPVNMFFYNFSV